MAYKTDFQEVKKLTTIDRVAAFLGLKQKGNRIDCPHSSTARSIIINPNYRNKDGSVGNFRCFACNEHGDLIQLAVHINKVPHKQAAQEIERHFNGPVSEKRGAPENGFELEYEHQRVQAHGLTPERAQQLGIGFRNKATTRYCVLFPLKKEGCTCPGPQHYVIEDKDKKLRLPKQLQDVPSK